MKKIFSTLLLGAAISACFITAGCGEAGCHELADLVCDCYRASPEACASARSHAQQADDEDSGLMDRNCVEVADKFSCTAKNYTAPDEL